MCERQQTETKRYRAEEDYGKTSAADECPGGDVQGELEAGRPMRDCSICIKVCLLVCLFVLH